MNLSNILIVTKETGHEYQGRTLGLEQKDLLKHYRKNNISAEAELEAHYNHLKALDVLQSEFPEAVTIKDYQLNNVIAEEAEAILFVGGDNTLIKGSHHVTDTPIVGITSNTSSDGTLNKYTYRDGTFLRDILENDEYNLEYWPRIYAEVEEKSSRPALSEIYLGSLRADKPSRIHIAIEGKLSDYVEGSGIIVATPAGRSGWYRSAGGKRKLFNDTNSISWLLREQLSGKRTSNKNRKGWFGPNNELKITSCLRHEGIISIDSVDEDCLEFNRGKTAIIRYSETPLKVIMPYKHF